MTKYKLYKHDARIYKDWWVFPLAVQVHLNDMIYRDKNFTITLHFLCFHVRWLFRKEEIEACYKCAYYSDRRYYADNSIVVTCGSCMKCQRNFTSTDPYNQIPSWCPKRRGNEDGR